jgi:hypothetical protein
MLVAWTSVHLHKEDEDALRTRFTEGIQGKQIVLAFGNDFTVYLAPNVAEKLFAALDKHLHPEPEPKRCKYVCADDGEQCREVAERSQGTQYDYCSEHQIDLLYFRGARSRNTGSS